MSSYMVFLNAFLKWIIKEIKSAPSALVWCKARALWKYNELVLTSFDVKLKSSAGNPNII